MANVGYQAKSLIGGVSTRPYALRTEGQATDQENCYLSPKWGLVKRPGTNYLQTIESNATPSSVLMFPLYRNDADKVVVATSATSWQVFNRSGVASPVAHFPSSTAAGTTAAANYGHPSPIHASTTTMGDVTWVSNASVTPAMKTDTWEGYTEEAGNDNCWTLWVKHAVWTKSEPRYYYMQVHMDDGTKFNSGVATRYNDAWDGGTASYNNSYHLPSSERVAAVMGYRLHSGPAELEGTSMETRAYSSPGSNLLMDGTDCMMGRLDVSVADAGSGTSAAGSRISSVTAHIGGAGSQDVVVAYRVIDKMEDLPPSSWLNHTLNVSEADKEIEGHYMRFVSDDAEIQSFSQTSFDATMYLPRKGHWEEYCGTGVTQSLDSATMPHLFVRRPDNSFAFMEARGNFVINSVSSTLGLSDEEEIRVEADGGFSGTQPLVVGETVQFSDDTPADGAIGSLPTAFAFNTNYYVVFAENHTGAYWDIKLSATKGGSPITYTNLAGTDKFNLKQTTYENFDWTKRVAGDDISNPIPTFVGNRINSIFNFQNRLAFVSEGEVIFSGVGDYFNFWRTTVRDLLDDDPFALAPNTEHGDILKTAIAYDRKIVLVSNKAQFGIAADTSFGPLTARIERISQTASDFFGMPIVVGGNVFLAYQTEDGSGVFNLSASKAVANTFDSENISQDIPGFLPLSPRRMDGSEKHGTLCFLDDGSPDTTEDQNIYVYTWLDSDKGRVHSAWTKWTFGADFEILDILVVVDRVYMVVKTAGILTLEFIDLDMTTEDSLLSNTLKTNFDRVLIDHKTHNVASTDATAVDSDAYTPGPHGGIYSEAESSGDTVIMLKWKVTGNNKANIVIVKSDGTIYEYDTAGTAADGTITVTPGAAGTLAYGTTSTSTMTKLVLNGVDITSADYYVGLKYTMSSTFGPFVPQVEDQALGGRNIFVRGGRLTYSMANEFKVSVTHDQEYLETISATTALDGTKSGDVKFAVRKDMPNLAFTVTNEKPWNSMFQILYFDLAVQEVT